MVDSERYHKALRKCFLRSYGSQAIVIPEPQKTVFETEVKKNNSTFAGLMGIGVTGMYFLRTRVLRKQLTGLRLNLATVGIFVVYGLAATMVCSTDSSKEMIAQLAQTQESTLRQLCPEVAQLQPLESN